MRERNSPPERHTGVNGQADSPAPAPSAALADLGEAMRPALVRLGAAVTGELDTFGFRAVFYCARLQFIKKRAAGSGILQGPCREGPCLARHCGCQRRRTRSAEYARQKQSSVHSRASFLRYSFVRPTPPARLEFRNPKKAACF